MKNKVTIHDISRALKIDSSTVSRALNNSSRVTEKTKEKILKKAKELGYQRNLLASNLRKNKTNTIGVIVPRISRHFFSSLIAGIEETAYNTDYNIIICQSLELLERETNIVASLAANRVAGVLMSISMETKNYDHLIPLQNGNIPLVFFDRQCNISGHSTVLIDDYQAGFDATEHLIQQGCKSIAHLSGPQSLEIYKNRYKGYKAALEKHGLDVDPKLVISSELMEKDGAESIEQLLEKNKQLDGVFSANDIAAISAIKHLKKKGIEVPKDIAIVGFSNEPISELIEPSLSTIDQPGFEMGKMAANLLLKQINSAVPIENETIILKPNLIKRNSCKYQVSI
ncbi:MAG: LacI family DNA-binding transcriptional regulator [Cellulophaga sp.]